MIKDIENLCEEELVKIFEKLVKQVASHKHYKVEICDSILTDTIDLCFKKLPKYLEKPNCNPFNYFVTIIGCYLRQIKRMQMNHKRGIKHVN